MGNVIARNAAAVRIIETVGKTLTNAKARGGEIQSLTEGRLAAVYAACVAVDLQFTQARDTSNALHAVLMARDGESDREIGAVADEIWNTLGRSQQSVDYNLIMGSGKKAWTDGDPAKQPQLMKVLANNIRQTTNAKLVDKKEAWAARIEQRAEPQRQAAEPIDAADAQVITLKMQRRTLANSAQVELTRLKRDLKNLGLSEAQVHEIIPDVPAASAATPAPQPTPPVATATAPQPKAENAPETAAT